MYIINIAFLCATGNVHFKEELTEREMRIKDIPPVRAVIRKVALVRAHSDEWEIHFWLGESLTPIAITRHYPATEPRTWKSINNAFTQAEGIFDLSEFQIVIQKELINEKSCEKDC